MRECLRCGHKNSARAKFCEECASPLPAASVSREQRKTVTVIFCDLTGSTALGETNDPEALRALLARYFERMRAIVESHGGTVEKFIGDAVMAVFGVPRLHEDDALRAVRAALEMRDALPELGLQARIGVNTGEVVTGTEERLATGDAVNVAARLEQAAEPGEVLIGEPTVALVRDAVETEPVASLELKGKAEPVPAWRLLAVNGEQARRPEAPMVGRGRELQALRDAFARAEGDRSCQLFTVLGTAGVGKSRLAAEFLKDLDATVVLGRCLSYGKGITYWPVVEVVKQLDALPTDQAAAASLRSLLGESDQGTSAEEIALAFRKLLEERARAGPVVCLFDDLHWGEQAFLDLVEHIADLSRDAPLLVLCMARPELLDGKPGWGGGKLNATTVLLEPLSAEETDDLLEALGGVDEELRLKIREAAEGNPLFVEEMLALVREAKDGEIVVPPTIQALLAARLDQLEPSERSVLERGSVEGRVFHRGAMQALAPEETQLAERLVALVRKELVRPDKAQFPGDDAFRFRHLLIRDAAYDGLPKATRAELHERFADWLEERGRDRVELDEILGHHLEQAARYKQELGQLDPGLAERAGEHLASAGRLALWRSDMRAARVLLNRALELTRPHRLDVALECDLADAYGWTRTADAAAVAESAGERAHAAGDETGEAVAQIVAGRYRMLVAADPRVDELETRARAALPKLERMDDHAGLVHVWATLVEVANFGGRHEEMAQAAEQALRHSRLAGQKILHQFRLHTALVFGPRAADEALLTLDAYLREPPDPSSVLRRAQLLAMLGRFEEARMSAKMAGEQLVELTGWGGEHVLAEIDVLAGEHENAARLLREHCDRLEKGGERAHLSTYAPALGRSLCALGQYDEAERLAQLGRELGGEGDQFTQMIWRQVQALVHAHRDEHVEAERLAREAVAITERMDAPSLQGHALCDLGEVLAAADRTDEAAAALEQALDRYERKKNLAMVAQVRPRFEALRAGVS
ncbi:MAG: AAA family ATPase [Actinomycetota bacterium]|nr:AAA family ATPase [Actinomycetota bacterium]